jgi:hypothetical protein
MFVFFVQTERYTSLENQIKFGKVFTFLNYCLIGDENATVKLGSEKTDEFFATSHVSINEKTFEVIQEWLFKKLVNEFVP